MMLQVRNTFQDSDINIDGRDRFNTWFLEVSFAAVVNKIYIKLFLIHRLTRARSLGPLPQIKASTKFYIYIYIYTHTHTHIYIYIYIYMCVCIILWFSTNYFVMLI